MSAQVELDWTLAPSVPPHIPASRPLTERGKRASQSAADRMPGFVLEALGDALLTFHTSERPSFAASHVRAVAEQSEAVKAWLDVATRVNCFPGWFRAAIRRHNLERAGDGGVSPRDSRRGGHETQWRFPEVPEGPR